MSFRCAVFIFSTSFNYTDTRDFENTIQTDRPFVHRLSSIHDFVALLIHNLALTHRALGRFGTTRRVGNLILHRPGPFRAPPGKKRNFPIFLLVDYPQTKTCCHSFSSFECLFGVGIARLTLNYIIYTAILSTT
jgi:hypothetical protein